jgi:hypothetical protein
VNLLLDGRIDQAVKASPAIAAGVETRSWEMADTVRIIDAYQPKISN